MPELLTVVGFIPETVIEIGHSPDLQPEINLNWAHHNDYDPVLREVMHYVTHHHEHRFTMYDFRVCIHDVESDDGTLEFMLHHNYSRYNSMVSHQQIEAELCAILHIVLEVDNIDFERALRIIVYHSQVCIDENFMLKVIQSVMFNALNTILEWSKSQTIVSEFLLRPDVYERLRSFTNHLSPRQRALMMAVIDFHDWSDCDDSDV